MRFDDILLSAQTDLMCSLKNSVWLTGSHVSSMGLVLDFMSCVVISTYLSEGLTGMHSLQLWWDQALSFSQLYLS